MVSTDGRVPHPDFALKGRMVFRLSTARGLVTSLSLTSFCAWLMVRPRSSNSARSCLCLRTARIRSKTKAARSPKMTTPTALTIATIVVVLKGPLASARERIFVIVSLFFPVFNPKLMPKCTSGAVDKVAIEDLGTCCIAVLVLCTQLVSSSFNPNIQASRRSQQQLAQRIPRQKRSQNRPNIGPYASKHTFWYILAFLLRRLGKVDGMQGKNGEQNNGR
jgi:hypothetical protein